MDNIEKELTPVSDEDNSIEVVADAVAEATFESTTTPARVATAQNELKTPLIPSVKSHRAPKTNPKNSAPLSGNKGKVSTDKVRKSVSSKSHPPLSILQKLPRIISAKDDSLIKCNRWDSD